MPIPHPIVPGVAFLLYVRDDRYCVGDDGSVWSRCLPGPGRRLGDEWRLKTQTNDNGYRIVMIGRLDRRYVNEMVLETFIGLRPDGMFCRHLNDIRHDNRLVNLAWGSPRDNADDAVRNDRLRRGETVGTSKLTEDAVREIRRMASEKIQAATIARKFGISHRTTRAIIGRETWKHVV